MDRMSIVFAVLAALSWCGLIYVLLAVGGVIDVSTPGDFGMNRVVYWLFSFVLAAVCWILLGILLARLSTPGVVAVTVFLFSAAAAAASLFAVSTTYRPWPVIVPMLLPPLLSAYLVAIRMSPRSSQIAVAAVIAVSLLPWPRFVEFLRSR